MLSLLLKKAAPILFAGSLILNAQSYLSKKDLPFSIQEAFEALAVHRIGVSENSSMITHGFTSYVSPDREYEFNKDGLSPTGKGLEVIEGLNYVDVEGVWFHEGSLEEDEANILGDSGRLILNAGALKIPEARTTKETVDYYGSKLLAQGDKVVFGGPKEIPIASMTIEENYVKDYLLQGDLGGGAYIEYHDNPHFHMPADENSGGYLILGKKISKGKFRLSAFKIPLGSAIYTVPYALHADSFLTGRYKVGYHTSDDYSTGVIKDPKGGVVTVSIASLE